MLREILIPPARHGSPPEAWARSPRPWPRRRQAAGAEIRTGAEVIEIRVKDGAATGVLLSTGEEISANAVISNADPKRTLLKLTAPTNLSPDFVQKMQHYRGNGTVAKVNLALSGLPTFTALKNAEASALKGRIHIGPEIDYLERAFDESKYGQLLEATISRSHHSHRSPIPRSRLTAST